MKSPSLKSFGASSPMQEGSTTRKDIIVPQDRRKQTWHHHVAQEVGAVFLWVLISIFLKILIVSLVVIQRREHDGYDSKRMEQWLGAGGWKELLTTGISVLAGWILQMTPSKVSIHQAPGFIFANPWMLQWVRGKTGVVPNLQIRTCEYVMGRISLQELAAFMPIHIFVTAVLMWIVQRIVLLLPPAAVPILQMALLEPIPYSVGENPSWVVDFIREIACTSAFTVTMLVLPVLLQLNYMPRWIVGFAIYPLLNFSVDGSGMASAFSPNILLAMSVVGNRPLPFIWRLMGPLIGGLIGGRVMKLYFPDRERVGSGMRGGSAAG